jgi:hypothetical protein
MTQIHGLRIALVILSAWAASATVVSCAGTTPAPATGSAVELCATAVALSPEVRAQAAKLQREPLDFARQSCAAVLLAAQVVQANIPELGSGSAGAASLAPGPTAGTPGKP